MASYVILGICIFIALCNILTGIRRGLNKSLFRLITLIAAAGGAFFLAPKLVSMSADSTINALKEKILNDPSFSAFLQENPAVAEIVSVLLTMLLVPLMFLLLYLVFKFVTWIIFAIISNIFHINGPKKPAAKRLGGLVVGVLCAVIGVGVFLIPVFGYAEVGHSAAVALNEQNPNESSEKTESTSQKIARADTDYLQPILKTPVIGKVYEITGSKVFDKLTVGKINEKETNLKMEIKSISAVAGNALKLTDKDPSTYGKTESDAVRDMTTQMSGSPMLSALSSCALNVASNSWLKGDAFFGIQKPDFGQANDVIDGFLTVFSTSNPENVGGDMTTLSNFFALMVQYGVFAKINDGSSDDFMTFLAESGFLSEAKSELDKNERMKPVTEALVKVGKEQLMNQLGVTPETLKESCGPMLSEMNTVLRSTSRNEDGTYDQEQLAQNLNTTLQGYDVELPDEVLDIVAESVSQNFSDRNLEDMTEDEVIDLLVDFISNTEMPLPDAQQNS